MPMRYKIAILLAVITTINYIDRSVFGVAAPVIRDLFTIGDADYGLISSGFLFAYGIGQLVSGPIIDRLGTKKAFSIAAIFWSIATVLHALGRGVWSFFTLARRARSYRSRQFSRREQGGRAMVPCK